MTEPTSDLVKRLDDAAKSTTVVDRIRAAIEQAEAANKSIRDAAGEIIGVAQDAYADIRALEAEVERSRKQVAALTTALELAGDEVVDFETTIRSRSNGAEPEFLSAAVKNDGVTARSTAAADDDEALLPLAVALVRARELFEIIGASELVAKKERIDTAALLTWEDLFLLQKYANEQFNREFAPSPDTSPTAVGDEVEELARIIANAEGYYTELQADEWKADWEHYTARKAIGFGKGWKQFEWENAARAVLSRLAKSKGSGVSPAGWKLTQVEGEGGSASTLPEGLSRSRVDHEGWRGDAVSADPSSHRDSNKPDEPDQAPEALREGGGT